MGDEPVSYRQKEVDAIKAQEASMEVTEQVKQAREKARKLLCKTCENGICTNGCAR